MSSHIDFVKTCCYNLDMILTYSNIINIENSERKARNAIAAFKYVKVAPGLYSNSPKSDSYIGIIFSRYKNITVTMQTAFEFYDLTDVNFGKYTIAFPHGSRKVKEDKIKQYFIESEIYDLGRIKVEKNGVSFYIYNKERLLIELIRNKKKLPYDYYKEIVNSYRTLIRNEAIDTNLLLKYAKSFKRGDKILETIMEVVA